MALRHALLGTDQVFTTGLVLQELLQGFAGPKNRAELVDLLSALAFPQPVKEDHIEAAEVRNSCRRCAVQVGTIDALLIQLRRRNDLTQLTTDQDFHAATKHVEFLATCSRHKQAGCPAQKPCLRFFRQDVQVWTAVQEGPVDFMSSC